MQASIQEFPTIQAPLFIAINSLIDRTNSFYINILTLFAFASIILTPNLYKEFFSYFDGE